ncbi:unnamed protein product [Anisakis simplex]|uniref:Secreted protein n=1 Tax=Anisakis simplex TaxID=6269 RepID=A0A0M3K201_ANISI|nr:unnamed protein product [Anisakis simplex]
MVSSTWPHIIYFFAICLHFPTTLAFSLKPPIVGSILKTSADDLEKVLRKIENQRIFASDDGRIRWSPNGKLLLMTGNDVELKEDNSEDTDLMKSLNRNCLFSLRNCLHFSMRNAKTNQRYQQYVEGMQTVVDEFPANKRNWLKRFTASKFLYRA